MDSDSDGVRVTKQRGRRRVTPIEIGASIALIAGLAFVLLPFLTGAEDRKPAREREPAADDASKPRSQRDDASAAATARRPRLPVARRRGAPPDSASGTPAAGKPSEAAAREYIDALRASGKTGGIAAYPPPGTSPPKAGNVVPEDYTLPEGYVRHYQSTDDGKQLDAILMFSPDYEFFDENGNPLAVPEDRVVPPHLVPPDLPLRPLEIPAPDAMP